MNGLLRERIPREFASHQKNSFLLPFVFLEMRLVFFPLSQLGPLVFLLLHSESLFSG